MKKSISNHIVGWLIYYLYAIVSDYLIYQELGVFLDYVIYLIPHAWVFYSVYFVLIYFDSTKKLYLLKRFAAFVLSLSVFYFLTWLYKRFVMPILDPNYKKTEFKVIAFIVNNSLVYFKYFIYGLALFYANRAFKRETELRMEQEETFRLKILQLELERENQKKEDDNLKLQQEKLHLENQQLLLQHQNLQYQYAYLRAQMNPHNLQNLLNMLIAKLVRAGSADMINPMVILSKIMRYSMDVKTDEYGRVPLGPEIEHVHNILKMNEYRQKTTNAVDFKLQGHEAEKASIVPLIIIPFIENAIKYAVLDDESDPLQIHIKVQNNQLLFFTRNKIKSSKAVLEEGSTSHGIGLSNTRQRLNATYGEDGYSLQMQKEGDYFSVTLTIFDLQIKPKIMLDDVLAGGEMMA